ncbi:MAG: D-alanine--D-alanine ligase [Polaribacter sp.]|nr:D-alanine--D-alanine ligase [Polaribacter sp.]MDG1811502.1 D-alanine--D-alanine ligase [Polaribacter sp.]MDG1993231.1 D-alanine--D-alanine ligase [Polaribacter sp.]
MKPKKSKYKLLKWEYWPSSMFYIPNIPFAFLHAIKAKNLSFYTAVNPTIANSGIGTESKYKTMQLIPKKYLPITIYHKANSNVEKTIEDVREKIKTYPLIAKPDIGFRGLLVQKIASEKELIRYVKKYPIDILIQEFLTEKNECGIFYLRYPNDHLGKITSITLKDFPHIIGDGTQTVEQLILSNERMRNYKEIIKNCTPVQLKSIVAKNKKIQLCDIGNHSRGTQFIDGNHLISKKLEETFTVLNKQINGWFYGRIDIKYNTFKDLEKGNFKIIELNGILAEPTHIYDTSKTNYLQALKEMRSHWKQLYKIARINHDKNNVPYRSTLGLLKDVKNLKKHTKSITKLYKNKQ